MQTYVNTYVLTYTYIASAGFSTTVSSWKASFTITRDASPNASMPATGVSFGEFRVVEAGVVTGQDFTGAYFGGGIGGGLSPFSTYGFVTNATSYFEKNP